MVLGWELFVGLTHNLAVLIALIAVYGVVIDRTGEMDEIRRQIIHGLSFGLFAVGCMYAKIPVAEGVIADQRNAMVALSGAFGGPLAAIISAVCAGIVRYHLGGAGVTSGLVGLTLAVIAGSFLHFILSQRRTTGALAAGSFVSVLIILPGFMWVGDFESGWALLKSVAWPYGTAVFIGIFLGGILLATVQDRRTVERERNRIEAERLLTMMQLEKADKAKSEFLAAMSHELRTPLNAILGFSEMIMNIDTLPAEQRLGYAKDIHESGQHLLELIDDILDVTAIEAGKRIIDTQEVDVADLLAVCVRSMENAAARQGVTVVLDLMPGPAVIQGDLRSIRQIVLNILSNAIKFSEADDRVDIILRTEGGSLSLTVRDQGIGIPEEAMPRLGEPFLRTNADPHIATAGTGLGLSIVKSLVGLHMGTLDISSRLNEGTTVRVTLPQVPGGGIKSAEPA